MSPTRLASLFGIAACLAAGCAPAPAEVVSSSDSALDREGTERLRLEVEVLSGARSAPCADGLATPGCAILGSSDQTFSRYAGSQASPSRLASATAHVCERFAV